MIIHAVDLGFIAISLVMVVNAGPTIPMSIPPRKADNIRIGINALFFMIYIQTPIIFNLNILQYKLILRGYYFLQYHIMRYLNLCFPDIIIINLGYSE
jgi:hypothetical protein